MIADLGWIIHKKPQGDTSLSLAVFTAEHGLIRPYFKGGRNLKKKDLLQAYTPIWLEWAQCDQHSFIRKVEPQNASIHFNGIALICAMYVNELLYLCLKHPEPSATLYSDYEHSLMALSQAASNQTLAIILREFEWALLRHCGFEYSLTLDIQGALITSEYYYRFIPQAGFALSPSGIPGETLMAIAHKRWDSKHSLYYAKQIMRMAINDLIDYKPIHSRRLLASSFPAAK